MYSDGLGSDNVLHGGYLASGEATVADALDVCVVMDSIMGKCTLPQRLGLRHRYSP